MDAARCLLSLCAACGLHGVGAVLGLLLALFLQLPKGAPMSLIEIDLERPAIVEQPAASSTSAALPRRNEREHGASEGPLENATLEMVRIERSPPAPTVRPASERRADHEARAAAMSAQLEQLGMLKILGATGEGGVASVFGGSNTGGIGDALGSDDLSEDGFGLGSGAVRAGRGGGGTATGLAGRGTFRPSGGAADIGSLGGLREVPAKSGARVDVTVRLLDVSDGVSREMARSTILRARHRVGRCGARWFDTSDEKAGRISVRVSFDTGGRVGAVAVGPLRDPPPTDEIQDSAVTQCAEHALRTLRFPAVEAAGRVDMELVLKRGVEDGR